MFTISPTPRPATTDPVTNPVRVTNPVPVANPVPVPGPGPLSMTRRRITPRELHRGDRGSATAEYAIATMAAVGFAGLLVIIMRSDEVRGMLTELVRTALTYGG